MRGSIPLDDMNAMYYEAYIYGARVGSEVTVLSIDLQDS
jgi:hypothetical protein